MFKPIDCINILLLVIWERILFSWNLINISILLDLLIENIFVYISKYMYLLIFQACG